MRSDVEEEIKEDGIDAATAERTKTFKIDNSLKQVFVLINGKQSSILRHSRTIEQNPLLLKS